MPYQKIYALADRAGVTKKEAFGPILESGSLFGKGWIGIAAEKPTSERSDVIHVKGEFQMYEHHGPYRTLGKACKKVRTDHPAAKEFLNLYLDDPAKVPAEDLRTQILFR